MGKLTAKADRFAGELYLEIFASTSYPEQHPEYLKAKWYDLLWLAIPIAGICVFVAVIDDRGK